MKNDRTLLPKICFSVIGVPCTKESKHKILKQRGNCEDGQKFSWVPPGLSRPYTTLLLSIFGLYPSYVECLLKNHKNHISKEDPFLKKLLI
jgi:hypothetical protein